jgi:hypothetical protein
VQVKIAQEQRGHASIAMTLNIYTHVVDASRRKAVEARSKSDCLATWTVENVRRCCDWATLADRDAGHERMRGGRLIGGFAWQHVALTRPERGHKKGHNEHVAIGSASLSD